MTSADVTPIRPGHEFDVDRLAHYLASHLEGVSGTLTARQFRGGQSNPTFLVETGTPVLCENFDTLFGIPPRRSPNWAGKRRSGIDPD